MKDLVFAWALRLLSRESVSVVSIAEVQNAVARYLDRVRGTDQHQVCPMCDGQGELIEASVTGTGEPILICDECDSLWGKGYPVTAECVQGFAAFMEARSRPALWTELAIANDGS